MSAFKAISAFKLSPELKARLFNPYVAMLIVLAMYIVKTVTKLTAGYITNSPVFTSDGFHNLSDILQAVAVMIVVYMARRPPSAEYPLGKRNIEFFSSLIIGISLLVLGLEFALQSVVGILHYLPSMDVLARSYLPLPEHKMLLSDSTTYPWLIGIMAVSGALSWVVSRYQIAVGKSTGHASLVADGEETASDGRIELIALLGIISQPLFGAPWLEYPLALVVAYLVLGTGKELFMQAFRTLLQHALPQEVEEQIRTITLDVPGVNSVGELKTFQVGQVAVCLLTVRTTLGAEKVAFVRYGIEHRLKALLEESGFVGSEIHLKFVGTALKRYRIAYALRREEVVNVDLGVPGGPVLVGEAPIIGAPALPVNYTLHVASSLAETTHLAICDVEDGHIARARIEAKPADPLAFLQEKLVGRIFFFGAQGKAEEEALPGITVQESTVVMPELLGI